MGAAILMEENQNQAFGFCMPWILPARPHLCAFPEEEPSPGGAG